MKKLVLLVTILALCAPGYGAVLVYKLTDAINPRVDFAADTNSAAVSAAKLYTYVVFDVNVNTYAVKTVANPDINDANLAENPTAIVTGTSGKASKHKFYVKLGGADSNFESSVFIGRLNGGGTLDANSIKPFADTAKKNTSIDTLVSIDIVDNNSTVELSNVLFGKNTSADIGEIAKLSTAKSLMGNADFRVSDLGMDGLGTGHATLDMKFTKDANKNGQTVKETVDAIITALENKKFEQKRFKDVLGS